MQEFKRFVLKQHGLELTRKSGRAIALLKDGEPLFTYFLLVYVSGVRMLEARADKKWGDNEEYIKYKTETPVLMINYKM